jgi:hypothetical protein
LERDKGKFLHFYLLATKCWMTEIMHKSHNGATLRRDMSLESRGADFSAMFRRLCVESDLADGLLRSRAGPAESK